MMIPTQPNTKRPMKIIAFWVLLAMPALWIVAGSGLGALTFPPLFPSGEGIAAAMPDQNLGVWGCNIGLLFGICCAGHLFVWLKPYQANVQSLFQYWTKLVPLALLLLGLLAILLMADLHPGTGGGRRDSLFRGLAASTFGIGVLASMLAFLFGFLFLVPIQTVRIGYRLMRSAA